MGEIFSREDGVEERDNCVCKEIQKNLAPRYEFGDLLKNLNKFVCVKRYCSPLLLFSYFSKTASSSEELTVIGRSARLLHGGMKESCIYQDYDHYFLFKVKVGNEITTGTGPNKKIAKRNAAEAMLLQLGYKASTPLQDQQEKVRTNCYDAHILPLSRFLSCISESFSKNKSLNLSTPCFRRLLVRDQPSFSYSSIATVVNVASPPVRVIKNRNVVPEDSVCAKVYM